MLEVWWAQGVPAVWVRYQAVGILKHEGRMAGFGLLFSFGIDDGELAACSRPESFTLGYELALVREVYAKSEDGGSWLVHAANADRIKRACRDSDRTFKLHFMANDSSESWMQLTIDPK